MKPTITSKSTKEDIQKRLSTIMVEAISSMGSVAGQFKYITDLLEELKAIQDKNELLVFLEDGLKEISEDVTNDKKKRQENAKTYKNPTFDSPLGFYKWLGQSLSRLGREVGKYQITNVVRDVPEKDEVIRGPSKVDRVMEQQTTIAELHVPEQDEQLVVRDSAEKTYEMMKQSSEGSGISRAELRSMLARSKESEKRIEDLNKDELEEELVAFIEELAEKKITSAITSSAEDSDESKLLQYRERVKVLMRDTDAEELQQLNDKMEIVEELFEYINRQRAAEYNIESVTDRIQVIFTKKEIDERDLAECVEQCENLRSRIESYVDRAREMTKLLQTQEESPTLYHDLDTVQEYKKELLNKLDKMLQTLRQAKLNLLDRSDQMLQRNSEFKKTLKSKKLALPKESQDKLDLTMDQVSKLTERLKERQRTLTRGLWKIAAKIFTKWVAKKRDKVSTALKWMDVKHSLQQQEEVAPDRPKPVSVR